MTKRKRGEYRRRRKAAKKAERKEKIQTVRPAIFERAQGWCECCRIRPATSMHEDRPKSLFGNRNDAISEENSYAVCGTGTTGCHGHLQRHEIVIEIDGDGRKTF